MFNKRETATILAALLYWREEMSSRTPAIQRPYLEAVGFPRTRPLSSDEIIALSKRLRSALSR